MNLKLKPKNLLDFKPLKNFIQSKWYPGLFQIPTVFIFGLIMYLLLLGPEHIDENFGSALTWILWWPLIPLFFLLLGRFWCAICPFATISDFIQKYVGLKKPIPKWLRKYGMWIVDIIFIIAVWVDHIYGIVENPRGSAYFLLFIFGGVVVAGILFERRAWCRYLCTIGGLSGNYSRAGMLELRSTPDKCAQCTVQACYKGSDKAPGCPVFEFPRAMDSSANCNLCGYCIKSCPNDSIRLTPRMATKELWNIKRPKLAEAFLAAVIMGIVFIQNMTMLEIWEPILKSLENFLGTTNYTLTFTVAYIIAMLIPILLLVGFSALSSRFSREGTWQTFTRFGYAVIPLDLAGHLAHNLLHLFNEGGALYKTYQVFANSLAKIGMGSMAMASESMEMEAGSIAEKAAPIVEKAGHGADLAILPMEVIKNMQYIFLAIGILGSLYCIRRISQNNSQTNNWRVRLPLYSLIVVLGIINYLLFLLPMMERM